MNIKTTDCYVPIPENERLPETECIYKRIETDGKVNNWLEKKTSVYVLTPEELEEERQRIFKLGYEKGFNQKQKKWID